MIETLKRYVWETDADELNELIEDGFAVLYADVSLSVIYGELLQYFDGRDDMDQVLKELFGYYGLHALRLFDGVYYWLMQV